MQNKHIVLAVTLALIIGSIVYLESGKVRPQNISSSDTDIPVDTAIKNSETVVASLPTSTKQTSTSAIPTSLPTAAERIAQKSKKYERVKEISTPDGFVNLPAGQTDFKLSDIVGKKVILVDFWTYSCINCQRTTPYLNAWYDKYRNQGLEIVGIHTPEFDFEKILSNVAQAVSAEGIKYPVVLDNDYSTWTAYQNRFWPRKYLIDIDGFIVYDHIGEGAYDETEKQIQEALGERNQVLGFTGKVGTSTVGIKPVSIGAMSPETYFGSSRNEYFASGQPGKSGTQSFSEPQTINPNGLYLIGKWDINPEYAETSVGVGGGEVGSDRIDYRYQAKGFYFVAGTKNEQPIDVEVLRDSKPVPQTSAGKDIFYKDGRSYVRIKENRLYRLIDDKTSEDHLLELIISSPGLQAYTFTFG
jgi:thiol-disulfide isomerase/thioredoxin